jgi:hypothetical protein
MTAALPEAQQKALLARSRWAASARRPTSPRGGLPGQPQGRLRHGQELHVNGGMYMAEAVRLFHGPAPARRQPPGGM